MQKVTVRCARCSAKIKICKQPGGSGPSFCPTLYNTDIITEARGYYNPEWVQRFARNAAIQEGQCYAAIDAPWPKDRVPIKPRVQETVEFARKMKFTRLGIAFCDGLRKESATLHSILEKNGFQVASVVCCVGGRPKEEIGIQDPQKIHPGGYESMCNPIAQALVLNAQKTEFNILIGLCVGHDSLFLRYADAPCTVLIVKDRVLGHNPIAALHVSNSYYSHIVPSS